MEMPWLSNFAVKAESFLNNLDEQTGAAIRSHAGYQRKKPDKVESERRDHSPCIPKTKTLRFNNKHTPHTLSDGKMISPSHIRELTKLVANIPEHPEIESRKNARSPSRKSPTRQASQLNNSPARQDFLHPKQNKVSTLRSSSPFKKSLSSQKSPISVGDTTNKKDNYTDFMPRQARRHSLPGNLDINENDVIASYLDNLAIKNSALLDEMNSMHYKLTEAEDQLHSTKEELTHSELKIKNLTDTNTILELENDTLSSHVKQLQQKLTTTETAQIQTINESDSNLKSLIKKNISLEDQLKDMQQKISAKETVHLKLENDLRHAQMTISELQKTLEKTKTECTTLESDWDAYKLRVKNMLKAKDEEIKSFRDGMNLTEDCKILIEQIEALKQERDHLTENWDSLQSENETIKRVNDSLENRCLQAERTANVLRDTLRQEREYKTILECQVISLTKEIKSIQLESSATLSSLREAIKEKEDEIHRILESTTSLKTNESSVLNVGDYDSNYILESERIQGLTETLVQKQGRIDSLLANNNMLRIQLAKVETKLKNEISQRTKNNHSVVQLHECDCNARAKQRANKQTQDSTLNTFAIRLGVLIRRYPVFGLFLFFYMAGLHFWVMTVLFTSTTDSYIPKKAS